MIQYRTITFKSTPAVTRDWLNQFDNSTRDEILRDTPPKFRHRNEILDIFGPMAHVGGEQGEIKINQVAKREKKGRKLVIHWHSFDFFKMKQHANFAELSFRTT